MKNLPPFIEPLEMRIAPATLVSASVVTFHDVDGDDVTIKFSKPLLTDEAVATAVLIFDTGSVDGDNATGQQLRRIDLTALATPADATGVSITVTAKRNATTGGDGFVNVGAINAQNIDVGAVKIAGDLGRIEAGNPEPDGLALKSLDVRSMGEFGTSTQGGGTLTSTFIGSIGTVKIAGNLRAAAIALTVDGTDIKSVTIGGSLFGGTIPSSGRIVAPGEIGSVTIKGSIFGTDTASGRIAAESIGAVTVLGSVIGGDGNNSGQIVADTIGNVKIGGDLRGGSGDTSGVIYGNLAIGAVTIGGSMIGGGGEESGSLLSDLFGGSIKSIKIKHDIRGGDGEESAYIHADAFIGPIVVGGSVIGGAGNLSASLYAGNAVTTQSNMTSVAIGGDLVGGVGISSGHIGNANGVLGGVLALDIGKVVIKGSLIGGAGANGATIDANDIGSLVIGGSLLGAGADETASIDATGVVKSATIGGSLIGSGGSASARLNAQTLVSMKIGGDLRGGDGDFSGQLFTNNQTSGTVLKAIAIGGSVFSGGGLNAGSIDINGALGSVTIGGSVLGTEADPVFLFARGADGLAKPLSLAKLTIKGSAAWLHVLAGYSILNNTPLNADASIGKVSVGGDWIAGNIVAGVDDGVDGQFGTPDDQPGVFGGTPETLASIASITIKGQLRGTAGGADHFGFVAQQIGKVKIGSVTIPLAKGPGNDNVNSPDSALLQLGATGDFRVNEIPLIM